MLRAHATRAVAPSPARGVSFRLSPPLVIYFRRYFLPVPAVAARRKRRGSRQRAQNCFFPPVPSPSKWKENSKKRTKRQAVKKRFRLVRPESLRRRSLWAVMDRITAVGPARHSAGGSYRGRRISRLPARIHCRRDAAPRPAYVQVRPPRDADAAGPHTAASTALHNRAARRHGWESRLGFSLPFSVLSLLPRQETENL
jgi:hypothetical protein